jgi:hypothetical protein
MPYFLHSARFPRQAMVLIIDGVDNMSSHSVKDTIRSLLTPQSPFFYLLEIRDPYAAAPEERFPSVNFLSSAKPHILPVSDPEGISQSAELISRCINSQYSLSYSSSLTSRDNRLHKLEVKLAQADPHIKIESLPGYYIPGS